MKDMNNNPRNIKFIDLTEEVFETGGLNRPTQRKRIKLTPAQIKFLENCYRLNSKPLMADRERIAENINVPSKNVGIWFQNRRAKDRHNTDMIESQSMFYYNNTYRPPVQTPETPQAYTEYSYHSPPHQQRPSKYEKSYKEYERKDYYKDNPWDSEDEGGFAGN